MQLISVQGTRKHCVCLFVWTLCCYILLCLCGAFFFLNVTGNMMWLRFFLSKNLKHWQKKMCHKTIRKLLISLVSMCIFSHFSWQNVFWQGSFVKRVRTLDFLIQFTTVCIRITGSKLSSKPRDNEQQPAGIRPRFSLCALSALTVENRHLLLHSPVFPAEPREKKS